VVQLRREDRAVPSGQAHLEQHLIRAFQLLRVVQGLLEIREDRVGRAGPEDTACMAVVSVARMELLVAFRECREDQEHQAFRSCQACRQALLVQADLVDSSHHTVLTAQD